MRGYYSKSSNGYPAPDAIASDISRTDWTLAGRIDVNEHLLFKLEVHAIDGTRDITNVPGISNPPSSRKNSMTLFAAKTTISF